MQGCLPNTIKYLLFIFNLLVFLMGCVVLGFSIYAMVDGKTLSHLVENGAAELGESISVNIYTTSAIILVTASAIIVVISFLGCCGAVKENRFLIFLYFGLLLFMFLVTVVGATVAYFQSIDVIKEPLLKSMVKYNPQPTDQNAKDITRAWDDIQSEFGCCGVNNYTDWTAINGTIFPLGKLVVPSSCCTSFPNMTVCQMDPAAEEYHEKMTGCFSVFKQSMEDSRYTIGTVTVTIIAVMFGNLILLFGFALCLMPNSSYQSV